MYSYPGTKYVRSSLNILSLKSHLKKIFKVKVKIYMYVCTSEHLHSLLKIVHKVFRIKQNSCSYHRNSIKFFWGLCKELVLQRCIWHWPGQNAASQQPQLCGKRPRWRLAVSLEWRNVKTQRSRPRKLCSPGDQWQQLCFPETNVLHMYFKHTLGNKRGSNLWSYILSLLELMIDFKTKGVYQTPWNNEVWGRPLPSYRTPPLPDPCRFSTQTSYCIIALHHFSSSSRC